MNFNRQACGLAILRITVGIVFLMHGWQKLFVFGFHGVAGMLGSMGVPLPAVFSAILTLVEFFGGLALILGVAVRVASPLLAIDMSTAILLVHIKHGFFSPGVEFPLTLLAANLCLALAGPGALSLEAMFRKNRV